MGSKEWLSHHPLEKLGLRFLFFFSPRWAAEVRDLQRRGHARHQAEPAPGRAAAVDERLRLHQRALYLRGRRDAQVDALRRVGGRVYPAYKKVNPGSL